MIANGHESHELGTMMKLVLQMHHWLPTYTKGVYTTIDRQYIRISLRACDKRTAGRVLVNSRSPTQMVTSVEQEVSLQQIPQELWSQHKTDVRLVKSAQPLQIKLKSGIVLPYQRQYPLKQQAVDGIRPTIEGLLKTGVLIKTQSPCNTPIFPIKKPYSDDYRLVHDLRAINAIVDAETPLLSNIPPSTQWYTVIDLCSAFFSVPLQTDSQYLFAFTYQGQQYTYTRLAQGYVESPTIFNKVLADDLRHLDVASTVIQYVDDLLICSPTKDQCEKDSIAVLRALAKGGHKVSKTKLQFCQTKVEYLGRQLKGNRGHDQGSKTTDCWTNVDFPGDGRIWPAMDL